MHMHIVHIFILQCNKIRTINIIVKIIIYT